jgi:hypothetical protein
MLPHRLKERDIKVGLVVAVANDFSLLVLMAFGIMPRFDVTTLAKLAVCWVIEATRPVKLRKCLQCSDAGLRISVV